MPYTGVYYCLHRILDVVGEVAEEVDACPPLQLVDGYHAALQGSRTARTIDLLGPVGHCLVLSVLQAQYCHEPVAWNRESSSDVDSI